MTQVNQTHDFRSKFTQSKSHTKPKNNVAIFDSNFDFWEGGTTDPKLCFDHGGTIRKLMRPAVQI
jgi:hypothetical protein